MPKSLLHTAGEGTFWVSASTIVVKVVSLVAVFVMLSRLGVSDYGTLELVLSLVGLFSILSLPGLDTLVVADMGIEKGRGNLTRARQILAAYTSLQVTLALLACVLVLLAAQFLSHLYQVPVSYIQALCAFFVLGPLRGAYSALFRVNLQFFALSLVTFLEECFKLGFLLLFFFYADMHVGGVMLAMLSAQLLMLMVLAPAVVRIWFALSGGVSDARVRWRELLKGRGTWSVLTTYVGNVGKTARLWIIQRLLGAEAVGLYAVAVGLIGHTMALVPLYSVVSPMLPQYVHDKERFTKLLNKAMKYQLLAYLLLGVVGFFLFPPILRWLFPEYAASLPLFQVMLLGLIPVAFISVLTPAYFALKLQKNFFFSMLFKTVVSLLFTYGLVTAFGFFGLAYEYILTSVVYGLERLRTLHKHVPGISVSRKHLLAFDEDDRMVLDKSCSALGRLRVLVPWQHKAVKIDE